MPVKLLTITTCNNEAYDLLWFYNVHLDTCSIWQKIQKGKRNKVFKERRCECECQISQMEGS